jgi:hypothetical protein
MKKKGLGNLYDRFTPEERFRLYIEAVSRGDEAEVERLLESCRRKIYSLRELAFSGRCKDSNTITMGVCLELAPHLAKLEMIEAFREILPLIFNICLDEADFAFFDGHKAGSKRAWEAAGKTGEPPGWEEGDEEEEEDPVLEEDLERISSRLQAVREGFVGQLAELERQFSTEALTIWEAFASFCNEELLVEPEKLVKAWLEPMLAEIEKLKNHQDPPEVDKGRLKEYEATLRRGWKYSDKS